MGIFDVDVVAQNDVSSERKTLPKAIRVYDEISAVVTSSYYIDSDFNLDKDDVEAVSFDEKAPIANYR